MSGCIFYAYGPSLHIPAFFSSTFHAALWMHTGIMASRESMIGVLPAAKSQVPARPCPSPFQMILAKNRLKTNRRFSQTTPVCRNTFSALLMFDSVLPANTSSSAERCASLRTTYSPMQITLLRIMPANMMRKVNCQKSLFSAFSTMPRIDARVMPIEQVAENRQRHFPRISNAVPSQCAFTFNICRPFRKTTSLPTGCRCSKAILSHGKTVCNRCA